MLSDSISDAMCKLLEELTIYKSMSPGTIGNDNSFIYPRNELIKMFCQMRYLIMRSDITLDNTDKANKFETKRLAYDDARKQFEEAMVKKSPYDTDSEPEPADSEYETDTDTESKGHKEGRAILDFVSSHSGLKLKPKFIRKKVITVHQSKALTNQKTKK